jgi:hypothetical protein
MFQLVSQKREEKKEDMKTDEDIRKMENKRVK